MIEQNWQESWLVITLDRPEKANAITQAMFASMTKTLLEDKAEGYIIRGKGNNFSAGADLKEMLALNNAQEIVQYTNTIASFFKAFAVTLKPTIVECQGHVCGAGLGLCAAADFVIANKDSIFSCPEIKSNITPSIIAPYLINKVGLSNAKEMALTGRQYNRSEAQAIGLVSRTQNCFAHIRNIAAYKQTKAMFIQQNYGSEGLTKALINLL